MFQKPLKTYGRKPKTVTSSVPELVTFRRQPVFSPLSPDSSRINFDKYLDKSADKSDDFDPFETTFDRIAKDAKLPPRVSRKESRVHFADSATDSGEESSEVIPSGVDQQNINTTRSSSVGEELKEDESEEKTAVPDNPSLDSDLAAIESIEQVQGRQTSDSSTSDEYVNKSRDQSPLESLFDRLENNNLQPVPQQNDSAPQFVDTTTDSNEEPYEFIKIDNYETHITHRKFKPTVNNTIDKTDKNAKSMPVKTRVRKRQIKNVLKDSSDSDTSIKSSPVRKTRRGGNKISNKVSGAKAESLDSDKNKLGGKTVQVNEIKKCCVKLTRLELKENRLNNNEEFNFVENNHDDQSSCVEDEIKTRECIVRLSRLNNNNNNSKTHLESTLMQTFLSSTPCERRVGFKQLKPGVSPILTSDNASKHLTIPPTILLNDSTTDLFGDDPTPRKSPEKLELVGSEEINKPVGKRLELAEEETGVRSPDLFSSCEELPNPSSDSSVVDNTCAEDSKIKEDDGTPEESCRTLVDQKLSGQNSVLSVAEGLKSDEVDLKNLTDNSQSYEMEQRSSIDEMVLNEIDEGNFVSHWKSFSTNEGNSVVDSNLDVNKDNFTENSKLEISQDNLTEDAKSEINVDTSVENSKSEINKTPEALEINEEYNENSESMEVDKTSSTANMSIDNNNSVSLVENVKDKTDLIDSSETDDDYHLVVSNTSSNSTEQSSQEEENKKEKEEKQIECDSITENKDLVTAKSPEPFVLLERINNLAHITTRRRDYQNWKRDLNMITEQSGADLSTVTEEKSESPELNEKVSRRITRNTKSSLPVRRSTRIKSDSNEPDERPKKSRVGFLEPLIDRLDEDDAKVLYLKPGKSWARSLSILNNIRKEEDLDSMSTGNKGKKWRQSVRNVLSMQRQSVVQSCVKDQENEKSERETFHGDRLALSKRSSNAPKVSLVNNHQVESGAGRFARRMSVRVVPNSNKYSVVNDKIIEDSSFLKVYGISTDKNDEIKKKSLAPKESLIYQLRCSSTPTVDILPEPVSARNVVLQRCDQTDSLPFKSCYPNSYLKHCRKIGEGVYGEVFLYDNNKEKSVIKIIPIEGDELVNGEPQKKYGEILSEIIIAKELHDLRFNNTYQTNSFVEVKNIRCIVGKYPEKLLQLWDAYDEEKNSENDSPSMFTDDQLYIALELGNGGQDMEAFVFNNSAEAYITFLQAALALAVAEKSLDFEHRDMHWGNILISRTNEKQISCRLGNEEISLQCNGIKTTIIDFTLSRMSYQGCCIFNDLALDPALFTAVGEYQFDIYRLMKEKTKNNWQSFVPYTNILWLHYTLDKMITAVRYKNVTSKIHKQSIQKLEELKNTILEYESAFDFISNCDKLTSLKRSGC